MEPDKVYSRSEFCNSCLCHEEGIVLHKYCLQNENLQSLLREKRVTLCQYCKRLAQHVDQFIQNVENVQRLFDEFNTIDLLTLQTAQEGFLPAMNLCSKTLGSFEFSSEDDVQKSLDEDFLVCHSHGQKKIQIKQEVKEENGFLNDCDDDFVVDDDDNMADPTFDIKDELDLKKLIKKEVEVDIIDLKYLKKKLKKEKKRKRKLKGVEVRIPIKKESSKTTLAKIPYVDVIRLSREQCVQERAKQAQDEKYLNSPLKCEDCVKGFLFKSTYDNHMDAHKESSGKYECDVCKQRKDTKEKLLRHKIFHELRYRCMECSLLRKNRRTIHEHYSAVHSPEHMYFSCPHCAKGYKRKVSLRKHIGYAHRRGAERATCDYCQRTYANKDVLRAHLLTKHSQEMSVEKPKLTHGCPTCGKAFRSPSHLKKHQLKHTDKKDYYCVECDKSFKSDSILKHHLKTATPHVNYLELPFPCLDQTCDKRFAIRRDLDRHMNSIHLHIKPYQCDKCERGYASAWSLTKHKRLIHEGYKRPLKFPCTMCDKIFDVSDFYICPVGILAYLFPISPGEQRADVKFRHSSRSWASSETSAHVILMCSSSFFTVRCQVSRGLPSFRRPPSGCHVSAAFGSLYYALELDVTPQI